MRKNVSILILLLLFFCAVVLCGCAKCEEHVYSYPCDTHCNICGEVRELPSDVEHNFTKWTSNNDFTCEQDGTKYTTCVYCGKMVTAVDKGSATGHYYYGEDTRWRFNNDNTHAEDGTETQLCYLCDNPCETRVSVGTAGHNFGTDDISSIYAGRQCKECGWREPRITYTNIYVYDSFEPFKADASFSVSLNRSVSRLTLKAWTQKEDVKYTVVAIDGREDTNIRALKVEREAVSEEANNDAIVDITPIDGWSGPCFPTDMLWKFDFMIGEGNQADVYLSARKESEDKAYYNIFLWYCAETKQILVGDTVIAENIVAGEWYTVALLINDGDKTYDVYLDGEMVLQGVEYLNSLYPTAGECIAELYRITAMKGTEAVEFYLDNVKVYNSESTLNDKLMFEK